MNALKTSLITLLIIPLFALSVLIGKAEPVRANIDTDINTEDLSELIVLDSLFGFGGFDNDELAGLIALDALNGVDGTVGNDLSDLIVLDSLFGTNWGWHSDELAGLIVLDELF